MCLCFFNLNPAISGYQFNSIYFINTGFYSYNCNSKPGDESPSSKIILLVAKYKNLALNELLSNFSDQQLVYKRLDDLVKAGLIEKINNRYFAKPKGKLLIRLIEIYRAVLNWNQTG